MTDQNTKTTTYAYDDADRLTSVTDAANNLTTYGYDTESNLTTYGYDTESNLTSRARHPHLLPTWDSAEWYTPSVAHVQTISSRRFSVPAARGQKMSAYSRCLCSMKPGKPGDRRDVF